MIPDDQEDILDMRHALLKWVLRQEKNVPLFWIARIMIAEGVKIGIGCVDLDKGDLLI